MGEPPEILEAAADRAILAFDGRVLEVLLGLVSQHVRGHSPCPVVLTR